MVNKHRQDKKLNQIGIDLFRTGKLGDDQIEEIIASPNMFRAIKQKIAESGDVHTAKRRFAWQSGFGLSLAAYGLLAIVVVAAVFASIVERKTACPSSAKVTVHDQPDIVVKPFDRAPAQDVRSGNLKDHPIAEHAAFRSRERTPERHRTILTEEVSEFYPLTNGTDDDEEGGQIVRVRLPRAALLSMGVESPFETAPGSKIKTDLLIGSDGVMKAVRFVK